MSVNAKRRLDYQPPLFTISRVIMDVKLHPVATRITTKSTVERAGNLNEPLFLDGEKLTLHSVSVNGQPYTAYDLQDAGLLLKDVPDSFELVIETETDPQNNQALEGLYLSDGVFCTQCEAEGFRRITCLLYTSDAADE